MFALAAQAGELVAYETLVLGVPRPGYRAVQLRSPKGTRIELCYLFLHVALGDEPNTAATTDELREQLEASEALVRRQQARLAELEARDDRGVDVDVVAVEVV